MPLLLPPSFPLSLPLLLFLRFVIGPGFFLSLIFDYILHQANCPMSFHFCPVSGSPPLPSLLLFSFFYRQVGKSLRLTETAAFSPLPHLVLRAAATHRSSCPFSPRSPGFVLAFAFECFYGPPAVNVREIPPHFLLPLSLLI